MKRLFFFLAFNVMLSTFGQKVSFDNYTSWDATLKSAKKSNKKIFLYFGATWCAPCVQIKKKVLPDSAIQSQLKSDFLRYDFDIDQKSATPFLKKYRISTVPLILVLNADGFVTNRISEIPLNIPEFSDMLRETKANQVYLKGVSNTLELNTPEFYDQYFDNGMKQFPDSVVVESYLKSQKDLTTEVNWNVLSLFNTNDNYYYYIKQNQKRLVDLYGMEVKFQSLEIYRRIAERYIEAKDSIHYNQLAMLSTGADDTSKIDSQRAFLLRQILFLGRTGMDWNKFIEKSRLCIHLYGIKQGDAICQYALASKPSQEALDFLIEMMNPVLEIRPIPRSYLMYGTLLWYAGNKASADDYFNKAVSSTTDEKSAEYYKKEIEAVKKG